MRQTSKRARRSRLLMIFILVLLIALVLWGLAALADRLLHYGANATVSAKDADQPSAITPTPETADDTPKNTYDPACFYRDGEFLRYESSTVTSQIGIDVSAHQQDIDWQRVAASGVQFAILRAGYRGYTEGSIQEDTYFEQNLAGAIDAGLDVGVYFFSQAMDEQEAREEARRMSCMTCRRSKPFSGAATTPSRLKIFKRSVSMSSKRGLAARRLSASMPNVRYLVLIRPLLPRAS